MPGRGRILLIEDHDEYRDVITQCLHKLHPGMRIDSCADGDAARALLAEHKYTLIITDYDFPMREPGEEEGKKLLDTAYDKHQAGYDFSDIGYDSTRIFSGGRLIRDIRAGRTSQARDVPVILESGHVNGSALAFLTAGTLEGASNPTAFIHKEFFGYTQGIPEPFVLSGKAHYQEDIALLHDLAAKKEENRPAEWQAYGDISGERLALLIIRALALLGVAAPEHAHAEGRG